jgi:hypothetical protein
MGRDENLSAFRFKICMTARSMKMITVAGLELQDDPTLVLHYVSHFQYIDPVLQDALLTFIVKKN